MNSLTREGNEYSQGIIVDLLWRNAFPPSVILATVNNARHGMSDSLTNRVSRRVHQFNPAWFKGLFFLSGPSLIDFVGMWCMCHLTNLVVCSRDEQKKEYLTSGRQKKPGRPRECRTCDAGLSDGPRMEKNVVYSMYCSICDGLYVSLERPKGELEIALSNITETQRPRKHWDLGVYITTGSTGRRCRPLWTRFSHHLWALRFLVESYHCIPDCCWRLCQEDAFLLR